MFSLSDLAPTAPPPDTDSQARLRALADACDLLVKEYKEPRTTAARKEELKPLIKAKRDAIVNHMRTEGRH